MKKLLAIIGVLFLAAQIHAASRAQSPVESAKALFNQGRYADARSILRAEISKSPKDPDLYFWLGHCEFELYDNDGAISNAERAVQLAPNNSAYHYFLAVSYGRKAEFANFFTAFGLAL